MKTTHTFFLSFLLLVLAAFLLPERKHSNAKATALFATITVTTTDGGPVNVDGQCSLREAIINANGNNQSGSVDCTAGSGTDTIAFNIPGAGPHTIAPSTPLPAITGPVVIDGTTQPGASCTTAGGLKIELSGASAGAGAVGLGILGGGSTVRGLVINRFTALGILLDTNGGNTIACNYIGTDVAGTADLGNTQSGININNSPNNLIGGTTADA